MDIVEVMSKYVMICRLVKGFGFSLYPQQLALINPSTPHEQNKKGSSRIIFPCQEIR